MRRRTPAAVYAPSQCRVRITLNADEWAILGAVARKYRKPLGWVFQVAAHAFLEPMPRETRPLEQEIESE